MNHLTDTNVLVSIRQRNKSSVEMNMSSILMLLYLVSDILALFDNITVSLHGRQILEMAAGHPIAENACWRQSSCRHSIGQRRQTKIVSLHHRHTFVTDFQARIGRPCEHTLSANRGDHLRIEKNYDLLSKALNKIIFSQSAFSIF